jgi:hypothetical protein
MLLQDLTSLQARLKLMLIFFFDFVLRVSLQRGSRSRFVALVIFFEYDTNGLFDKQARDSQSKETKERIYDVLHITCIDCHLRNHYSSEYCQRFVLHGTNERNSQRLEVKTSNTSDATLPFIPIILCSLLLRSTITTKHNIFIISTTTIQKLEHTSFSIVELSYCYETSLA